MSHISKMALEITSLLDLKQACKRLGLTFVDNQKTYKWYGTWMGDSPLPEGISKEELGQCTHAIKVPECSYEIGVVQRGSKYTLLWDAWSSGGLEQKIGKNAGILKQAYSIEKIRREAMLKRYRFTEQKVEKGVRLVLCR
jgi:hypothetical protein